MIFAPVIDQIITQPRAGDLALCAVKNNCGLCCGGGDLLRTVGQAKARGRGESDPQLLV